MKKNFPSIVFVIILISLSSIFPQGSVSDSPALKEAKKSYSQKKYDTAIKQFTQYAESHPQDGTPYLYMGYIYESRKDFAKSISMFKKAVEGNLSSDQKKTTLLKLALYFNYYQEYNQAYIYSSRYLSMNPNNREIAKIRDKAEANRGKTPVRVPTSTGTTPSSTDTTNSVQTSKKSKKDYEEDLKKDPQDEVARWELALIAFNEKNYVQAEKLMIPLVDKFPNKPSYSYKLGVSQTRLEKYKEALVNFEKAKAHVPPSDTKFQYYLYLNEGASLYKLKRFKDSESSLKKAYSLNASLPPLIGLTRVYYNQGRFSECLETSEKILGKTPNDLENKMYRALCKYDSPEKDAGPLYAFEKEMRNEYPTSSQIPDTYFPALIKLARDYTNSEKYKEAEEYYKLLEKEYGQDREYLFYRGKALYYSNQPDRAIPYLERVERSTAAVYLTAKAYSQTGNQKKTEEKLKLAGNSKPIYWDLALEEDDFSELRKNPDFLEFLKTKGKSKTENNPTSP